MDSRKDMTKRLIADGFKALMLRYPFEKDLHYDDNERGRDPPPVVL